MARPPNRSVQTRLVLAALLERPAQWQHGYDLAKQTELQSGTLYPILMRLAEQGLEESWEQSTAPGRPPRHTYRLIATGVATARDLIRAERPTSRTLRLSKAPLR